MGQLLILTLSCCSLFLSSNSLATTFKIATLSPDGSSWMVSMKAAAKEITAKTDGRVKIRFYPGGVMGNDQAVLRKIRVGQLQGAALSGGALAKKAPNTQIYNLPLLFNSYAEVDHVRKTMDQDFEKDFAEAGFISFGLAEGGFAYIMSKKAIADANKLKDNKVWVPSDDTASQAAAKIFKLTPTPLSLGDVLTGLQTGLIDTIATSPIAAIALQWHTQVDYLTDLPIMYIYALLAIDKKAFNRISPEDQATVNNIMRATFTKINSQTRKDNESAFAALQEQGIKVIALSNEQVKVWEEKSASATDDFLNKGNINPEIHTRIMKLLTEFRQANAK